VLDVSGVPHLFGSPALADMAQPSPLGFSARLALPDVGRLMRLPLRTFSSIIVPRKMAEVLAPLPSNLRLDSDITRLLGVLA
jgi:hypothetical protein